MTESTIIERPATCREQAESPQQVPAVPTCERRPGGWVPTLAKFTLVGTSGMVVDMAVFLGSTGFSSLGVARAFGIGVAMTWNFFLDRRFTFAGCRRRRLWQQYFLFCTSCFLGAVVNWGISVGLCVFFDWFMEHPAAAGVVGVAAGFGFNFILSRRFVFPP